MSFPCYQALKPNRADCAGRLGARHGLSLKSNSQTTDARIALVCRAAGRGRPDRMLGIHWRLAPDSRVNVDDASPFQDMQGMLATIALANSAAGRVFCAVSNIWHPSEPNEPEYMYDVRTHVHKDHGCAQSY